MIDECGQLSAQQLSVLDIIMSKIMSKATIITILTRIPHICGYREELPGTLRYQHGILNRGEGRLALVRGSRSRLALVRTEYQHRGALHIHRYLTQYQFKRLV